MSVPNAMQQVLRQLTLAHGGRDFELTIVLDVDDLVIRRHGMNAHVELAPAVLDNGIVAAGGNFGFKAVSCQCSAQHGDVS